MRKLIFIFLFFPLISISQDRGCISGNCKNGNGSILYSNGGSYKGEWKNGKFHGKGEVIDIQGNKFIGKFINGEIGNGKLIDKFGNKTYTHDWKFW